MHEFDDTYHEAVGAFHLHSDFSDGSLSIPEIAEIAKEKGLEFLMFTDHNTLEPKRRGLEGWYGGVLVSIGYEINDPDDRNHYLAFRLKKEVGHNLHAKEYVRRVKKAGGFGIIAHPAEKRNFSDAYPPYPWTEWETDDFDGIEIWNQLSEWIEGISRRNLIWRLIHPLRSITYPAWETLDRWDRLNKKRRVVGVGGIDVHAHRIRLLGIFPKEIYPYKVQFRSIRTHVLTEEPLSGGPPLAFIDAENAIFRSLEEGRCFVVNFRVGDGRGFRFWAEAGEEQLIMGGRFRRKSGLTFFVSSPLDATVRLLRDGKEVSRIRGTELIFPSDEKGVYRVEAFRKDRGWIYTNPIVVL